MGDEQKRAAGSRDRGLIGQLSELAEGIGAELTERLRQLAVGATSASLDLSSALFSRPIEPRLAREAGEYLRGLRQVAGLTLDELAEAINLEDKSLLRAVEEGSATLSFELVLRLAALLARHDPVPFLIRLTRTYNPEVWRVLEDFGVGRLPLHYERERRFINIYRSHDGARRLSDEGFARVLEFTRSGFEMALHFVAEAESVEDGESSPRRDPPDGEKDDLADRRDENRKPSERNSPAQRHDVDEWT